LRYHKESVRRIRKGTLAHFPEGNARLIRASLFTCAGSSQLTYFKREQRDYYIRLPPIARAKNLNIYNENSDNEDIYINSSDNEELDQLTTYLKEKKQKGEVSKIYL